MLQAADMGGNDAGSRTGGKRGGTPLLHSHPEWHLLLENDSKNLNNYISIFFFFFWLVLLFFWLVSFFDGLMTVFHVWTEIYPGMPNKYQPYCCHSVCTCTNYSSTWTGQHGLLIVLSLNLLINSK